MQYEEMALELERRILSTDVILRYMDECKHVSKGKCFQCAMISSLTRNTRRTMERTAKALREGVIDSRDVHHMLSTHICDDNAPR